jgi:hypothetical protein
LLQTLMAQALGIVNPNRALFQKRMDNEGPFTENEIETAKQRLQTVEFRAEFRLRTGKVRHYCIAFDLTVLLTSSLNL